MRQHALTHKNRDGSQQSPSVSKDGGRSRDASVSRSRDSSRASDDLEINVDRRDDDRRSDKIDVEENGKKNDVKMSDDENSSDDPNRSNISSPSPTGNRKRPSSSKEFILVFEVIAHLSYVKTLTDNSLMVN